MQKYLLKKEFYFIYIKKNLLAISYKVSYLFRIDEFKNFKY